jgi:hypothetical protein
LQKFSEAKLKVVGGCIIFFVVFLASGVCGDEDFFEKSDCKKSSFEKRLYYGLEKTDGISQQQKDAINQVLKEFQSQKEKQMSKNVKKFQSDDISKDAMRAFAEDSNAVGYGVRASLLGGIHKILNQKQREQFIKKFQGMID